MIRLLYFIMALIEFLLLLGTILLFVLSDSRTIDIIAKDILPKYGIGYKTISGNLFTGIEIISLEYNSNILADKIDIRWNPIALLDNRIYITQFKIKNVDTNKILEIIESLPSTKGKQKSLFDYQINSIDITAKPLDYHGARFRDFELGIDSVGIDRDIENIRAKELKLSINSDLVNIGLHGDINKNRLRLNRVRLTDIDINEITQFVQTFHKHKKNSKKIAKQDTHPPLKYIKIEKLLATLKRTTYTPITLEKTKLSLSNITIDPKSSYNINAKKAMLIAETSFANTKQIGYIKNSKLYTKGDIITRKYLFDKYNLPLNKKELRRLPTKIELTQKGVWVDINSSAKNLLVLNSDFNIDIKKATHKLKYIYSKNKIYIHSKAKSSMSYSNDSDIDSLVLVDIAKGGYTTYEGRVKVNDIKGIPKDISSTLLNSLELKYKGDSKKLTVDIASKEIRGEFTTKGYKNANLTFHTKKSIYLNKRDLPNILNNSSIKIKSKSFIDFYNTKKIKIGLDIHSNIININSKFGITKPYKIKFDASIPHNSKLAQIDKNIRLKSIGRLDGLVVLDKNSINHISINNSDFSLSCSYNSKTNRLSRGIIYIADEKIKFGGSLDKQIDITAHIQDLNRFTKIVRRYYSIKLQKIVGRADINIKLGHNRTNISLKSKQIGYGDIVGNLLLKANIDRNSKVDIELKSKELRYKKDIKIHKLSTKFSIFNNRIDIDRYSFRFYNDYISNFFSNKKSYLMIDNSTIYAKKVWLNDKILIRGDFNIDSMVGNLNILSNSFSFKNRDFDLLSKFNLNLQIDKKRLFLSGLVEPLGKKISYKSIGSGIKEDSDIIIIQNKSQKKSTLLDNLKMNLRIKNIKPIRYKTDDIDIEFSNDITIIKDYFKEFKLLGTTTIERGYYIQENKKFSLDESFIYFSGNPTQPILEVKATYNKEQYNIQIFISGTTEDPIINFNSDPYLTQKEILSLILFDSTGENSGSGTELYALLGGTFAKELMNSLGISVDHLVLGQGIDEQLSVEVGKKISKDITLIYLHNNGKDGVKVRVDHSRHLETDIIIQPQSSSIEFLYKSD